jgi:hypothetical protein
LKLRKLAMISAVVSSSQIRARLRIRRSRVLSPVRISSSGGRKKATENVISRIRRAPVGSGMKPRAAQRT